MALTKSRITGRVPLPTDETLQYAELTFTLSGLDTEGADILPGGIAKRVVLIDSEIPPGVDLWRNTEGLRDTSYNVQARWTVKDRDGTRDKSADLGFIKIGNAANHTLADLLNQYAGPFVSGGVVYPTLADAVAAAIAAADDAEASAGIATEKAGDAADSAAEAASAAASIVAEDILPLEFASRSDLVAAIAGGIMPLSGVTYRAIGMSYLGKTGATDIPDLPGLVPTGDATMEHFGAIGDGVTNDAGAEASAQAWAATSDLSGGVKYGPRDYAGTFNTRNMFASGQMNTGILGRYQVGTPDNPVLDNNSALMINKISTSSPPPPGWDGGAIYGQLDKAGGSSFGGAAVTGYARFLAGAGDLIGVHGRAKVEASGDKGAWGGWFYATDDIGGSRHLIGVEVNVVKKGPDGGWQTLPNVFNTSRGVAITTEHNVSAPGTIGLYVGGRGATNDQSKWYTGALFQQDGIVPSSLDANVGVGNGEAIRLQGGSTYSRRYGGVRFEKGNFQYGISFVEGSYAGNAAILLGVNQRITFGEHAGKPQSISYDGSSLLNIKEMDLARDGVRLLTTRRVGWTTPTGTGSKASFSVSTVTTPELAARVKSLIDDLTAHGLIGE